MVERLNLPVESIDRNIQGCVKIFWTNTNNDQIENPTWNANHFICLPPNRKNNYDEIISKNNLEFLMDKKALKNSEDFSASKASKNMQPHVSRSALKPLRDDASLDNFLKAKTNLKEIEGETPNIEIVSLTTCKCSHNERQLELNQNTFESKICQLDSYDINDTFLNESNIEKDFEPQKSSYEKGYNLIETQNDDLINKNYKNENSKSPISPTDVDDDDDHDDNHRNYEVEKIHYLLNFYYEDAINIAFTENSIKSLPKSVDTNSIFLIDLNIHQEGDILADDNGAYAKPYGSEKKIYEIKKIGNNLEVLKFNGRDINENVYQASKLFYRLEANRDFIRKTIKIQNCYDKKVFNKMVLAYVWAKELGVIKLKVHGNSTKNIHPYIRTSRTTLTKIKAESLKAGSASLKYNSLVEDAKENRSSLCEYPKSISQIYKQKSLLKENKETDSTKDEYYDILMNRQKSDFVRSINFDRYEIACIMFDEQQFIDLMRFGASENNFSILNIDTTFKLGRFYVTYITYKNLSLNKLGTDEFPTFIGPSMVHVKRDFATYLRFVLELKHFSLCKKIEIEKIKCFITDDDEALHGAFKTIFKETDFMLCCNHMRKDIYKILNEYRLHGDEKEEIIEIVFGSQNDRSQSLIASEDSSIYAERANNLIDK
ncbi:unnamed protein product [Brachionus calyciflorus]|uniref:MULE transposase domain-containing protein n=1 Tax=Brachionus calyciflorus TaxID=104777 RepID=A0A814M7C4_9BILA|nr:unnamed protein product [Brachionus calyciflorus]